MKHHILIFLPLLGLGFCAGFVNGLLGAGGGILIVFGLGWLLREKVRDPRVIYATAIAVILPLSVLSAVQYFRRGSLDLNTLSYLIIPATLGGTAGALLLKKLSPAILSRIFAAVVLISGITLVL